MGDFFKSRILGGGGGGGGSSSGGGLHLKSTLQPQVVISTDNDKNGNEMR